MLPDEVDVVDDLRELEDNAVNDNAEVIAKESSEQDGPCQHSRCAGILCHRKGRSQHRYSAWINLLLGCDVCA
jgi:hypothetical protein